MEYTTTEWIICIIIIFVLINFFGVWFLDGELKKAGKYINQIHSDIETIENEISEIKDRISSIEMNISDRGPELF